MPGCISLGLVQCACVKERGRDNTHDLNICETERKYYKEKSHVGPQCPTATNNIHCRRHYVVQIFNVRSSLINIAEKYEICCPQWLVGCG